MLVSAFLVLPLALAAAIPSLRHLKTRNDHHWVTLLATAPSRTGPPVFGAPYVPPPGFNSTEGILVNATVRETFRVSLTAPQLRVRLTNVYSTDWLNVTSMTIAKSHATGSSAVDASSLTQVTFIGDSHVEIPAGADWTSDPIDFSVNGGEEVTVSTYLSNGYTGAFGTYHNYALNDVFYGPGDLTMAANVTGPGTSSDQSSYFVFAIEGYVPRSTNVIVAVGDSITDGYLSTTDSNMRWPDLLSARLLSDPSVGSYAIANLGIGGNQILDDDTGEFGYSLLSRLQHDVFSLLGVTHLIVFEGTNDIAYAAIRNITLTPEMLIKDLAHVAQEAHIRGLAVIGGTITPRAVPSSAPKADLLDFPPLNDSIRTTVNDWIRNSGTFDSVIDFDAALRNASYPDQMQFAYASPDFLHPNDAGYQAMANAFDLSVFGDELGHVNDYN